MSNPFIIKKNTELTRPLFKTALGGFFGTGNTDAHRFEISLTKNGEAVKLQNTNVVTGAFVNYTNMATVMLSGDYTFVEDGKAVVILSDGCYQLAGRFCLTINVDNVTVFAGEGTLSETSTDTIYDPDDIVPSLEEVLAQVDAARIAAAEANTAAANAKKTPYIGEGDVWYFWDAEKGMYVDSENKAIPELTFRAVTGEPGTNVQLVQTGAPDAPVITLTIPRGDTGAVDGIDYFAGNPSALGTASPGSANGVARGDHVHPLPGVDDLGAVSYNAQTLTDDQKQQARENIGAGEPYDLPEATESVLGGVKTSGIFSAPGGMLAINGEPAELVLFIEKATYSTGATIPTVVPFEAEAIYLCNIRGQGATVMIPVETSGFLMRGGALPIETISGTMTSVDTVGLSFAEDGAASGALAYINRYTFRASGTAQSQSTPTSIEIGPVWMLRKIRE